MKSEKEQKSRFDKDALTYFKEKLLEKRNEALEQVEILENRQSP